MINRYNNSNSFINSTKFNFNLHKALRRCVFNFQDLNGDTKLTLPSKHLLFISKFLKVSLLTKYNSISDIGVCDYIEKKSRFQVNYWLTSVNYNSRLNLHIFINELESVESLSNLFMGSNWLEREIWDMFGIVFNNHNDLRRILTDYGFRSHPLRKDFPLTGFNEVFYDESEKHVKYIPLELSQDYRVFNFQSPW